VMLVGEQVDFPASVTGPSYGNAHTLLSSMENTRGL
jgi:hypothetical protein